MYSALVIGGTAFFPRDFEEAVEAFEGVDAYVDVSSGGTYGVQDIPKREDRTPLHDHPPEQAADEAMASYGPRSRGRPHREGRR